MIKSLKENIESNEKLLRVLRLWRVLLCPLIPINQTDGWSSVAQLPLQLTCPSGEQEKLRAQTTSLWGYKWVSKSDFVCGGRLPCVCASLQYVTILCVCTFFFFLWFETPKWPCQKSELTHKKLKKKFMCLLEALSFYFTNGLQLPSIWKLSDLL